MSLRNRSLTLAAALLAAALPTPASAQQPAPSDTSATGGTAPVEAPPAAAVVRDATFEVSARTTTLLGRTLHFRGRVVSAEAGRRVLVERLDGERGWVRAARATTGVGGRFVARWRTDQAGRIQTRVVLAAAKARATTASPTLEVSVFRPARATWYGPGFFGNQTACGMELTEELVGVAHRTLPCGTIVTFAYEGRTVTAPVVDRGPFANGADWDLTQAAAERLQLTHTDELGFLTAPSVTR